MHLRKFKHCVKEAAIDTTSTLLSVEWRQSQCSYYYYLLLLLLFSVPDLYRRTQKIPYGSTWSPQNCLKKKFICTLPKYCFASAQEMLQYCVPDHWLSGVNGRSETKLLHASFLSFAALHNEYQSLVILISVYLQNDSWIPRENNEMLKLQQSKLPHSVPTRPTRRKLTSGFLIVKELKRSKGTRLRCNRRCAPLDVCTCFDKL